MMYFTVASAVTGQHFSAGVSFICYVE